MQNLQPLINSLQGFAQKRLNFERPPKLFFKQDAENAKDIFGKTAYYDPNQESITLFTLNRHPKDILRSFAHELVHHCQNLRGDLSQEKCGKMDTGYAQENDHMREMEREAYEQGSLCFRDWEDGIKIRIAMQQENKTLKENKKMVKISKKELKGLIGKILEMQLQKKKDAACGCDDSDHSGRKEIEVSIQEEDNSEESENIEEEESENIEEEESEKIQTPEQENALYESRFNKRNEEVFNKLKKLWVK
jgi:hypothetical protein